jgi:hypothetical protein
MPAVPPSAASRCAHVHFPSELAISRHWHSGSFANTASWCDTSHGVVAVHRRFRPPGALSFCCPRLQPRRGPCVLVPGRSTRPGAHITADRVCIAWTSGDACSRSLHPLRVSTAMASQRSRAQCLLQRAPPRTTARCCTSAASAAASFRRPVAAQNRLAISQNSPCRHAV